MTTKKSTTSLNGLLTRTHRIEVHMSQTAWISRIREIFGMNDTKGKSHDKRK